jgi:hypothetical protein
MNRSLKTKAKAASLQPSVRQVPRVFTVRPAYPAWIDAEQGLSFAASPRRVPALSARVSLLPVVVTPRVRDCLVLRLVERKKLHSQRTVSHAHGGR